MDTRANLRRVSPRPLALILGILFVLALSVVGWYTLAVSSAAHPTVSGAPVVTTDRGPGSDAGDRRDPYSPRDPLSGPGTSQADPYSPRDPMRGR